MKDSFNTYYQINKERFAKNTFDFIQNNDKDMTIFGSDKTHPSEAVHYAWFKEAMYRIKEVENVNNGN
jgi:predicted TIM-barrel fold metal-dependent hydrolase